MSALLPGFLAYTNGTGNTEVMMVKQKPKARVLCVCQGGNSRSVHLAYLLKYQYHMDALACGYEGNTEDTLWMLCNWADKIAILQACMQNCIPLEFQQKVFVMDVGPDKYFLPNHELLDLLDTMIRQQMLGIEDANTKGEQHVDCR